LLREGRSKRAVEAAEECADGLLPFKELHPLRGAALVAARGAAGHRGACRAAAYAAWRAAAAAAGPRTALNTALETSHRAARPAICEPFTGGGSWPAARGAAYAAALASERKEQAAVLRDIIGPLLFRPVPIDPAWLSWNGGATTQLAAA